MSGGDRDGPGAELVFLDGILVEATRRGGPSVSAADPLEAEDELVGGVAGRVLAEAPKLGHTIAHFCELIHESVKDLAASEVTAEFSVAVRGGAGVPFISSGEAEAVVRVKATWTKKPAL